MRSRGPGGPGWEREDPAAARGRVSLKSAGRQINSATRPGCWAGDSLQVMSLRWGSVCVPCAECGVLELAVVRYIPGFGSKYFKLVIPGAHCIGFSNATHLFSVQNGSVHQKDGLNDDDFEPYLNPQARPVSACCRQERQEHQGFLPLQGRGVWPPCMFPISTDCILMFLSCLNLYPILHLHFCW